MENESRLQDLFLSGGIHLERGALLGLGVAPKPSTFDFGKVEGMLLGIAVGDALGVTTESMLPEQRRSRFGEIRDYIPNRYVNEARGFPSDDTQLSFWALEQLIKDRGFVPENVATRFARGARIFGVGSTVREFLANFHAGKPWYESGPVSAGNGALMRIAPILVPHLRSGGTGIWVDTALAAMMTHNDRASTSACLAFVAMLWELLDMVDPPDSRWWLERYVELARDLEGETRYSPRGRRFSDYMGPLWRFVQEKLSWAEAEGIALVDACNAWYSGAFLLETVPSVLLILMRHAHTPEEAIVRAVNDTKDNDTIGAIVGAAVGALHGKKAIPERWLNKLSGRTTDRDDGRVFDLIDQARDVFFDRRTAQQPAAPRRGKPRA
jgi:ADP-ribosylglycohydrolase